MKSMKFLLACTVLCAAPAFADEGMWTFDNFPAAKVKAKYGVDITQAWLDHVRSNAGAAVDRLFGLDRQRERAGADQQSLRRRMRPGPLDAGHDYYTHGYTALTRGERAQVPGHAGGDPDVDQRRHAAGDRAPARA